ncbi:MAG: Lrp/AsnC family transcriptional regulator [Gammaproteobacteria bacterium]
MQAEQLDRLDIKLLEALQVNGRQSNVELSASVALSPSQCQRRLRRLEAAGFVRGYVALLDRARLGLGVMAFVNVTLEQYGEDAMRAFARAIASSDEILECWAATGESDYVMRVVARDLASFSSFLLHRLLALPMVASVKSNILLEGLKESTVLPLPRPGDAQHAG